MRITILAAILFLTSFIKAEASVDFIKEMRDKIAEINISFLNSNYPAQSLVDELVHESGKIINNNKELGKIIKEKNSDEKLKVFFECCVSFNRFYKTKPQLDSL